MKLVPKAALCLILVLSMVACEGRWQESRSDTVTPADEHLVVDISQQGKPLRLGLLVVAMEGSSRRDVAADTMTTRWKVFGTLFNETDAPIFDVNVGVEWFDASGRRLDSGDALIEYSASETGIAPGRLAKFEFYSTVTMKADEFAQVVQELQRSSKVDLEVTSRGKSLAFAPGTGWERLRHPPMRPATAEELAAIQRDRAAANEAQDERSQLASRNLGFLANRDQMSEAEVSRLTEWAAQATEDGFSNLSPAELIHLYGGPKPLPPSSSVVEGEVKAVGSGSTLSIIDSSSRRHYRIRLEGIEPPAAEHPLASTATSRLRELVLGKHVQVEWSEVDSSGRLVGKALSDGRNVGLMEVEEGLAQCRSSSASTPAPDCTEAELRARVAYRGIWSGTAPRAGA